MFVPGLQEGMSYSFRWSEYIISPMTRNGGHINPPLYHDYAELREKHGEEMAKRLIRFRLEHFKELHSIAVSKDILEYSQCRKTETFDVHTTSQTFKEAKQGLAAWKAAMPVESSSFRVSEGNDPSAVRILSLVINYLW